MKIGTKRGWTIAALLSEMVLIPVIAIAGGAAADHYFDSSPWLLIVCGLGGLITAGKLLVIVKNMAMEDSQKDSKDEIT